MNPGFTHLQLQLYQHATLGYIRDVTLHIFTILLQLASLQVAAYADHHICVRKAIDSQGRAQTVIEALADQHDRVEEIAAMLGECSCASN